MTSPLLGILRLIAYLGWTLLLIPAQVLAVAMGWPLRYRIPVLYHGLCARIIGLDLVVRGTMAAPGPAELSIM